MSIQVTCASCKSQFNAPDDAGGKRTKCPKCGGIIEIPAPRANEELREPEEAPSALTNEGFDVEKPADVPVPAGDRKPCPMCGEMIPAKAIKCRFCGEVLDASMQDVIRSAGDATDPAWQKVRGGLNTIYNCIVIMFATIILMVLVGAISGALSANAGHRAPGARDFPAGLAIAITIGGLIVLGSAIGMIVGQARCASVPESSGAKGYATGAILCMVVNILLSMVGGAIQNRIVSSLGSLIAAVGSVLFILFIRQSAAYLNNRELAASAGRFLIFGVSLFVGAFLLGALAGLMVAPALLIVVGLLVVIGGLIAIVWNLRLIKSLMTTIDQSASGQRARPLVAPLV